jgi:hypothetical protein
MRLVTRTVTWAAHAHELEHGHGVGPTVLARFRDRRSVVGQCEFNPRRQGKDGANVLLLYECRITRAREPGDGPAAERASADRIHTSKAIVARRVVTVGSQVRWSKSSQVVPQIRSSVAHELDRKNGNGAQASRGEKPACARIPSSRPAAVSRRVPYLPNHRWPVHRRIHRASRFVNDQPMAHCK